MVDLYSRIHGTQAHVKDFTAADRDAQRNDEANFGPAKVGYWDRWETGKWDFETDGKILDREYQGPTFEEIARKFASK